MRERFSSRGFGFGWGFFALTIIQLKPKKVGGGITNRGRGDGRGDGRGNGRDRPGPKHVLHVLNLKTTFCFSVCLKPVWPVLFQFRELFFLESQKYPTRSAEETWQSYVDTVAGMWMISYFFVVVVIAGVSSEGKKMLNWLNPAEGVFVLCVCVCVSVLAGPFCGTNLTR